MFETKRRRLTAIVTVVVVTLALFAVYGAVAARGAERRQERLLDAVEEAFRGTSAATVERVDSFFAEGGRDDLSRFLRRPGRAPDVFVNDPEGRGGYRALYGVEYWGQHRCVRVVWTNTGVDITAPDERCRVLAS